MKDVNSSNASTRQPTPGIDDSKALFESSNFENFRTSIKSKLAAQAGSRLESEKAAPPPDSDWNSSKGYSEPPVDKANKNESSHSTSKLSSLIHQQPAPSWQSGAKPLNENKRTLYNPAVSGRQQRNAGRAGGYASGAGDGSNPADHQRTAAWARSKKESVEFEGLLADITLGGAGGAGGNARKQPEGYVLQNCCMCENFMKSLASDDQVPRESS